MTVEEATPETEVWLENAEAVNVFIAAINQWRVGFGGAYALDYNVFPIVAPREFNSPEWPRILESVRVMEDATLEYFAETRDRKK